MPDLSFPTYSVYPRFPRRALLAAGAVVLMLAGAAVVVNEGGGSDVSGCAVAAARVMGRHGYSAGMMELMGRDAIPACRGLSEREFVKAIMQTYRIEYGHPLARGSGRLGVPSPGYRARSAESALRQR